MERKLEVYYNYIVDNILTNITYRVTDTPMKIFVDIDLPFYTDPILFGDWVRVGMKNISFGKYVVQNYGVRVDDNRNEIDEVYRRFVPKFKQQAEEKFKELLSPYGY